MERSSLGAQSSILRVSGSFDRTLTFSPLYLAHFSGSFSKATQPRRTMSSSFDTTTQSPACCEPNFSAGGLPRQHCTSSVVEIPHNLPPDGLMERHLPAALVMQSTVHSV